jgi:hypothetical protein
VTDYDTQHGYYLPCLEKLLEILTEMYFITFATLSENSQIAENWTLSRRILGSRI